MLALQKSLANPTPILTNTHRCFSQRHVTASSLHKRRKVEHGVVHASASASAASEEPAKDAGIASTPDAATEATQSKGVWGRIKMFFTGEKMNKERLAALGLGAVASYGFLSNVVYGTGMAVTWIIFVKQRAVSPLAPGQWPAFLAFYAGFWTINNFIRPFRFGIAVAMAPVFDAFLDKIKDTFGWKTKRSAFLVYLALLGSVTLVGVFGSIGLFAGPQAFART